MKIIEIIKFYVSKIITHYKYSTSVIDQSAYLDKLSSIGKNSVLFRNVTMFNSSLGAYSYIQSESKIYNTNIGNFCSIASNVIIGLDNHPTNMVSTSPVFYDNQQPLPKFFKKSCSNEKKIIRTNIESDVWLGHGVLIKAGVSIGVGTVIGAGSIVTKNIPPYMIAAGNPCKIIRPRFQEVIIDKLLMTEWWKKSDIELEYLAPFFSDPLILIEELKKLNT